MTQQRQSTNYVDPELFEPAMDQWLAEWKQAQEDGEAPVTPSNYIGECIIKIADGIGMLYKFRRYPYLDEMKLDAIENAIRYLYNFDRSKGSAFSFISNNVERTFITRINREHRQTYYKLKTFQNAGGLDALGIEVDHSEVQSSLSQSGITTDCDNWVADYEEKQSKRRAEQREKAQARTAAKREKTSIVKFMGDK